MLALLLALPTFAQDGMVVEDARQVAPFQGIAVNASMDVAVVVGPERSVTVVADEDVVERVRTEVIDGELRLETDSSSPISVRVTVPSLERARLAGSGDLTITEVHADRFQASLAGAGDLVVSGDVREVAARSVGSGRIDLSGVQAVRGDIELTGSGAVHVNVRDALEANVAGSGDILYIGMPEVFSSIAGTGRIQRAQLTAN